MDHAPLKPLWHRIAWLALIWFLSVAALGLVAGAIRWWLNP